MTTQLKYPFKPLGSAQKAFYDRLRPHAHRHLPSKWPLLEAMLASGCLAYVDFALAERLLERVNRHEESIAAFVCHLAKASRMGNICVRINDQGIIPTPEQVWTTDEKHPDGVRTIQKDSLSLVHQLISDGAKMASLPLIGEVSMPESLCAYPLCRDGDRFYLNKYWHLETKVVRHVRRLTDGWVSALGLDIPSFKLSVNRMQSDGRLLPEQAEAVMAAATHPLTFITGGPGTGKTYTAGMFLKILWEVLPPDRKSAFKVAIAAPTGKAAANLEASLKRGTAQLEGFPAVRGQTLHQLLGIGKGKHGDVKTLNADLILIDECSMIDIKVMSKLLEALKPGAHVAMLGDSHQLASIEAGSLFADFSQYYKQNHSAEACVVDLKTCLRAELRTIIDLAEKIKSGEEDEVVAHFASDGNHAGITFHTLDLKASGADLQRQLVKYALSRLPDYHKGADDPSGALSAFAKFRLLTPLRQGPLGVEALNQAILHALEQKHGKEATQVQPIMIAENAHDLELFNGEAGLLIRGHKEDRSDDYALFAARGTAGEVRRVPFFLLPRFELAYCMTVHKSQGSEFDHVLLVLPDGAEAFGREGLYTGVTRAKRAVEVWSHPDTIGKMIRCCALRQSGIVDRLGGEC